MSQAAAQGLPSVISPTSPFHGHYCPLPTDEETEAERGPRTEPVGELGFSPSHLVIEHLISTYYVLDSGWDSKTHIHNH